MSRFPTALAASLLLLSAGTAALSAPTEPPSPAPQSLPPTTSPTTSPPVLAAPALTESPGEIEARVHYERAVRAELDGRWAEAEEEARAARSLSPPGSPFGQAAGALAARVRERSAQEEQEGHPGGLPTGASSEGGATLHRVELVTTATLVGLYSGALAAGATNADTRSGAALLMLGTGLGLGASALATSGKNVPAALAPMLSLGASYGTWVALATAILAGAQGNLNGPVLGAELGGAALGLLLADRLRLTGGDAGAAGVGALYGAVLPGLVHLIATESKAPLASALFGSAAGLVLLPLLNRELRWSRSRWNLISTGGGVGALFGGGLLVIAKADTRSEVAFGLAAGTAAGLILVATLTSGFDPDEPRTRATALLQVRPGEGLRLGGLLDALGPAVSLRQGPQEAGLSVRAFDARF